MSITLVTGGQRSGKSTYAMNLAKSLAEKPVYLATSRCWDEEYKKRIDRHKAQRESGWINIEEELYLSNCDVKGKVVVIDCVTLWCTNFFFDNKSDVDLSLKLLKDEFDKTAAIEADFIFVTNEIGMGGVSDNLIQRKFTDLQGWINQYIASKADHVVMMVCGIPLKVK
ncbi:MAG: bifunctional adenosylcobinamide kinase/adenosylcobinamide-phosphate guanylyltransferase [Bacteroidales bacterium]|nr:bifunctional adenosylcobinamide kinase/adenosylcobinamide-phosphate guanylyltransferase [Bacteroidales bacterium]